MKMWRKEQLFKRESEISKYLSLASVAQRLEGQPMYQRVRTYNQDKKNCFKLTGVEKYLLILSLTSEIVSKNVCVART